MCKVARSRGKERMILLVTPGENGKGEEGSGKKSRIAPFSDHILIRTDPLEKLEIRMASGSLDLSHLSVVL